MTDPSAGEPVRVLWVKGSGGDLGSMKLDGFATRYQDRPLSPEAPAQAHGRLHGGGRHFVGARAIQPCSSSQWPKSLIQWSLVVP